MRPVIFALISPLVILTMSSSAFGKDHFPVLKGPYLGQEPPGSIPELFAPGIVSTDHLEIEGVFAPDLKAFYHVRQRKGEKPMVHTIRYQDGQWQPPVEEPRVGEIAISIDGSKMYLGKSYRERTDSGWSEDISLGPDYEDIPIMRLTASAKSTFFFDEREEIGTIRYSRLIDNQREEPKALSSEINSGKWTAHPFIAADESYLIWDSEREGGHGASDLYISFRQQDGSWGSAINMGPDINSKRDDAYGSVTSDGKYFFFHRVDLAEGEGYANIFWVDAQVIENLRLK